MIWFLTNMSKAYNKVEGDFLRLILLWMGFAQYQVQLVMQCVTIISYSMVFNGTGQIGLV